MASIDKLKKRVENNKERREADKRFLDHLNAREILVAEAPDQQEMDFYCEPCNKHDSYLGRKVIQYVTEFEEREGKLVEVGDHPSEPLRASFVAHCKKGHLVRRYITDKERDPYFRSPILRRMAQVMEDDMLQPSDPRFAKVYPKQWAELQSQKEEQMMMVEAQAELHG